MLNHQSYGRRRGIILCLVLLAGTAAAFLAADTNPGDTPPLPISSGLATWEDVGALFPIPNPTDGNLNVNYVHYESDGWWHHHDYPGTSPLGGAAFNAPAAVAAGRIVNQAKDYYVTAVYSTSGTGNFVEVRLNTGAKVHLDAGNGAQAPRRYGDLCLAAGDVDRQVDPDGTNHDEIIVLYNYIQDGVEKLRVTVLDYHLATLVTTDVSALGLVFLDGPSAALAAGDVNGDGAKEVLVGFQAFTNGTNYPNLIAYRYENGHLVPGSTAVWTEMNSDQPLPVCLAAGDLSGDGVDEVALGAIKSITASHFIQYKVVVYGFDANLTASVRVVVWPQQFIPYPPAFTMTPEQCRLSVGIGWFGTPDPDQPLTKRQLVIANLGINPDHDDQTNNGRNMLLCLEAIDFDATWLYYNHPNIINPTTGHYKSPLDDIKVIPGDFKGTLNPAGPAMDLGLVLVQNAAAPGGRKVLFSVYNVWNSDGETGVGTPYFTDDGFAPMPAAFPLISVGKMDWNGESVVIGPPFHIVLQDYITPNFTIEEPPKHVDYVPTNPDADPSDWEWDTVYLSRDPEFKVKFTKNGEYSQKHTGQTKSEGGMGLNAGLGVDITAKFNLFFLIKCTLDADIQAKIDFAFKRAIDTMNTHTDTYSYDLEYATDCDDMLLYKTRNYDIWRYPVYGYTALNTTTEQVAQSYYEVVYPPSDPETVIVAGQGCPDFYQPIHQNGNVLSYPVPSSDLFKDYLGEITYPGAPGPVKDFLNKTDVVIGVDGGSKETSVTWQDSVGKETSKSWEEDLSGDIDFKLSASVKEILFSKQTINFNLGLQANGSWSQLDTDDKESSQSQGLTISVPSFPGIASNGMSYKFKPYAYISSSGNTKVQHAAIIDDSSGSWWKKVYNWAPDPGLNMPAHFMAEYNEYIGEYDTWVLNDTLSGKCIRGFFVETTQPSDSTGDPITVMKAGITAGTGLTLTVRIHNFSLMPCQTPFNVKFEYVAVNGADREDPGGRHLIGYAQVDSMQARGMQEVSVHWDTTGLGPTQVNASNNYRIWVTLDIPGTFETIHPRGSVCDNKEGFWPWSGGIAIWHPTARKAAGVWDNEELFEPKMVLGVREPDDTIHFGWGVVPEGQWSRLGVLVSADVPDRRNLQVVFYDWVVLSDKPQKAIACHLLNGVSWHPGEGRHLAHANHYWRPLDHGLHFIRSEFRNPSIPASAMGFPADDRNANLFVWVPDRSARKDLDRVETCALEVESRRDELVARLGEPLYEQLREYMGIFREAARDRLDKAVLRPDILD